MIRRGQAEERVGTLLSNRFLESVTSALSIAGNSISRRARLAGLGARSLHRTFTGESTAFHRRVATRGPGTRISAGKQNGTAPHASECALATEAAPTPDVQVAMHGRRWDPGIFFTASPAPSPRLTRAARQAPARGAVFFPAVTNSRGVATDSLPVTPTDQARPTKSRAAWGSLRPGTRSGREVPTFFRRRRHAGIHCRPVVGRIPGGQP